MSRFRSLLFVPAFALGSTLAACGAAPMAPGPEAAATPTTAAATTTSLLPATAVTAAVDSVFDRPSGGIDRSVRTTYGDYAAVLRDELRWDGDSGRLRQDVSFEGLPETPEARALHDRYAELAKDIALDGRELTHEIAAMRSSLTSLVAAAATDAGDGWWRGLLPGSNGMAAVGVHLSEGVADEVTLAIVDFGSSVTATWLVVD